MTSVIFLIDLLLLLNLYYQLDAATCEVKNQITQIHVYNTRKIVPVERLRIVHEQK